MKIIVQAGGLGTRLLGLTQNRPKCLVAVKNRPIIFHLFDKYQNCEFIIISDYKNDVLEKYLKKFATVKYKLIKASGIGNICGIKDALSYLNDDENFLLIWSDLILSEDFKPEELPSDNYIGILPGTMCSWSFNDVTLNKTPSDKYGVAGCFFFKNKKEFQNISETGSFLSWLKNSNINLKRMEMPKCIDVGTIDSIKKNDNLKIRCRPYNKINFLNNKVKKIGITPEAEKFIKYEAEWYKKMLQYRFNSIPNISQYNPLIMSEIDGGNIFQNQYTLTEKDEIIKKIISALNKLHSYETIPSDKDDIIEEYYTKTIKRLETIRTVIPFSNDKFILINGKKCKNPLLYKEEYKTAVQNNLINTVFCPIHGDCTFSNILLDKNNNIYFIDPRGYFGKQKVFGDVRYDWAKLYYSISGNFDMFNIKNFELKILDNEVIYQINSNKWENFEKKLFSYIGNYRESDIKFIHSIIWLSLSSHCWEDYDSMCLAFYNGVYLINEHI